MDLQSWLHTANGHFTSGLLIFTRMGAAMFSAPVLSAKNVPHQVRIGLTVAITMVLTPLIPAAAGSGLPGFMAGMAKEAFVGLVLGWTASLLFASVQMAGEWLDLQSGFQAGKVLNPVFDTQNAPIGNFKYLLAGIVFLGTGGHASMIRASVASFAISPPGSLALGFGAADDWSSLLVQVIWIAVQLAAPIAAALFLVEVAVGLANRALPQMNAMILTLPLKAMLAIGAIAMATPLLARALGIVFSGMDQELITVLRAMAGK